jgi:hypothetical protein
MNMHVRRILSVLPVMIAAACASRSTAPHPNVPAAPPVERPVVTTDVPMRVAFDSSVWKYQVESRTAVFAITDTTTALDSILISAQLRVSMHDSPGDAQIALSGSVDRLLITSGLAAAKTIDSLPSGFRLDWRLANDSVVVPTGATQSGCDQLHETARDLLISILPPLPETMSRDQSWSTISTLKGCRAGLAVEVQTRNTVKVLSTAGPINKRQVMLESEGSTSLTGSGKQGTNSITLHGAGLSTTRYSLDLVDGFLRSTAAQSRTQIEFDMGYRTDRFIQRTTRTITRVQ